MIELKRDAIPKVVLNNLYKFTPLADHVRREHGRAGRRRPAHARPAQLISHYVDHQRDVVVRRTQVRAGRAEARAHILEGLLVAIDNLDAVIELIRGSRDPDAAREGLIEKFDLSPSRRRRSSTSASSA